MGRLGGVRPVEGTGFTGAGRGDRVDRFGGGAGEGTRSGMRFTSGTSSKTATSSSSFASADGGGGGDGKEAGSSRAGLCDLPPIPPNLTPSSFGGEGVTDPVAYGLSSPATGLAFALAAFFLVFFFLDFFGGAAPAGSGSGSKGPIEGSQNASGLWRGLYSYSSATGIRPGVKLELFDSLGVLPPLAPLHSSLRRCGFLYCVVSSLALRLP